MLNSGMAAGDIRKERPEFIYELRVRAVEVKAQGLTHATIASKKIVIKTITDKTPEQLKLPFALWTRLVICQFIQERLGIELSLRLLGHYHQAMGI